MSLGPGLPDQRPISRRTLLRMGVAAALGVGGAAATATVTRPALAHPAGVPTAAAAPGEPRYRFAVRSPVPDLAPLGRLEEVWASPYYLTVTDCTVGYVGENPFVLTPEESAIVDVVEATGGPVADRQATYLTVLAASTRIDPARLDAKLSELGRGIVAGSLALAPQAPQARALAAWMSATA